MAGNPSKTKINTNYSNVTGGADVGGGGDGAVSKATRTLYAGDKRHSTGNSTDGPTAKKSSLDISTVKRPQPTKKVGIAFNLGASKLETTKTPAPPVKLKLGERKDPVSLPKASLTVSNAFNDDDDSDEDEMPAVAKMRMKNIGRETPTAAGPNSFGKGRLGFCNRRQTINNDIGGDKADN